MRKFALTITPNIGEVQEMVPAIGSRTAAASESVKISLNKRIQKIFWNKIFFKINKQEFHFILFLISIFSYLI